MLILAQATQKSRINWIWATACPETRRRLRTQPIATHVNSYSYVPVHRVDKAELQEETDLSSSTGIDEDCYLRWALMVIVGVHKLAALHSNFTARKFCTYDP